jgi:hypothetical protein
MKPEGSRADEARRKAQGIFGKKDQQESGFFKELEKANAASAAKTAKLRALRLAKEAADREAAAVKPPVAKRKRAIAATTATDKPDRV